VEYLSIQYFNSVCRGADEACVLYISPVPLYDFDTTVSIEVPPLVLIQLVLALWVPSISGSVSDIRKAG
jgi:hypothetical protein